MRTYTVYKGELNGVLVYIGTTIQKPEDRFRWHKHNGMDFKFTVLHEFSTSEEMLNKEFELIQKYKPKHNKIQKRKQNLNVKLTQVELDARIGLAGWCQTCLKRRTNEGYKKCYFCK